MKNEFKKIQSQFHKESILKIITGALAFGLTALGVVVFLLRLKEITLSYLLYVAIFLGATLVGGGVLTLFLYKSEKRIARRIDEKYHLHESVQTMVEYKDVDGALVGLQRADAERRLERIPRKFEWKRFWQYLVALGLAIAIFICAMVTGLIEVLGTLIGYFAVSLATAILPFALAFAGGTMLYVISDEMIPETHAHGSERGATYALLIGFAVMLAFDFFLG